LITAAQLQTLTSFTPRALSRALAVSGHRDREFQTAEFLGITNGGQFCYSVSFYDKELEEAAQGKVFLTYNTDGSVTADY
jgi:hypothetical protein